MNVSETMAATLNCLNDDCLLYLLKLLNLKDRIIVERVCKRWRGLCQVLWRHQKVLHASGSEDSQYSKYLSYLDCEKVEQLQTILIRCGENLKTVKVDGFPDTVVLKFIGKYCPNIEHLSLNYVTVSSDGIKYLASYNKNLRKIQLYGCYCVTDDLLKPLLLANQDIQQLNLSWNGITGTCFKYITPCVQNINVSGCRSLHNECLKKNLKRFCHLLKLNLSYCDSLTNSIIKCISDDAPQLQELTLRYCKFINDDALNKLSNGCLHLEILDISYCKNITNNGVQELTKLSNLKLLNLSNLSLINDDALLTLSTVQTLQKLYCNDCPLITDLGVIVIINFCEKLTDLSVYLCKNITLRTINEAIKVMEKRLTNSPLTLNVVDTGVIKHQIPKSLPELLIIKCD